MCSNIRVSSRTLLVVSTGDLEKVALEFIAERVTDNLEKPKCPYQFLLFVTLDAPMGRIIGDRRDVADFGAHALLHEGTELALIVHLDDLLGPIGRVGDVELHLDGVARSRRRRGFVDRSRVV